MPAGIEMYDRNTQAVILTYTDRVFKEIGAMLINANDSGSMVVPEYGDSRYLPGWYITPPAGVTTASSYSPNINVSGSTLSWSPSNLRFQGLPRAIILRYGYF